jgi:trehalose 2-sulfotransferase
MPPADLSLSDAAFDRPPEPVRTKLVLCSTGRTGSFLLCRALVHHGIGVPHEYCNAVHARTLGPRWGIEALRDGEALASDAAARRAYFAALQERRTANGIFAVKLHWWQVERYLDNAEGLALLQDAHFIHLQREDVLAQAVSLYVAQLTGRWSRGAPAAPPPPAAQFFDAAQLGARLRAIAEGDAAWRLFFGRNGIVPLALTYEAMLGDLAGTVRRIIARFGLAVPPAAAPYVPAPPYEEPPGIPAKAAIRDHFLAASRRITPARR